MRLVVLTDALTAAGPAVHDVLTPSRAYDRVAPLLRRLEDSVVA